MMMIMMMGEEDLKKNSKTTPNQSLYEQTFKFIKFQKPTQQTLDDIPGPSAGNSNVVKIDEFYKSLIEDVPVSSNSTVQKSHVTERRSQQQPQKQPPLAKFKFSSKSFLKSVQDNDLEYVSAYLEQQQQDFFVVDDFKWNALMISIAAFNNTMIRVLLKALENVDLTRRRQFIAHSDLTGCDCLQLAKKVNNREAVELIESFNNQQSTAGITTPEEEEVNTCQLDDSQFYCDTCNSLFNESQTQHCKSIVHQLNDNPGAEQANYFLRSNNKGYELLVKSGWNESSGLGLNEQGVRKPVRAKIKLNRHGIGLMDELKAEKNKSKLHNVSSSANNKLLKLKTPNTDETTTMKKTLKDFKKSERKLKTFERNFRFYFDN
jgi:hypothetical protein